MTRLYDAANKSPMSTHKKNIMIVVESPYGAGHMSTADTMGKALLDRGASVTIASSLPSYSLSARAFNGMNRVIMPGYGQDVQSGICDRVPPPADAFYRSRFEALKQGAIKHNINGVMIESWPFGLSLYDQELGDFVAWLADDARIPVYALCRDVLGYPHVRHDPSMPPGHHQPETLAANAHHDLIATKIINRYFEHVFVASDVAVCPLTESFNHFAKIRPIVNHAGFFAPAMPQPAAMDDRNRPVIVAGGGSFRGVVRDHTIQLVSTIAAALPHTTLKDNPLHILVGNEASDNDMRDVFNCAAAHAAGTILVERNRPDFRQMVANAALLVHKGSQNMAMEALSALERRPVAQLMSPLTDEQGNPWLEHRVRAHAFERAGLGTMLPDDAAHNPIATARAIETALYTAQKTHTTGHRVNTAGAANIARTIVF